MQRRGGTEDGAPRHLPRKLPTERLGARRDHDVLALVDHRRQAERLRDRAARRLVIDDRHAQHIAVALQAALKDKALVDRFADLSMEPVSQEQATPAALKKHLNAEAAKWAPIIKAAGVYAD